MDNWADTVHANLRGAVKWSWLALNTGYIQSAVHGLNYDVLRPEARKHIQNII
jgi:hypothetical protein